MEREQRQSGTGSDEDPREQGTGGGYPESNPSGTTPTEGSEQGPEADEIDDAGDAPKGRPTPSTSGAQDAPPSSATGNPGAAGG